MMTPLVISSGDYGYLLDQMSAHPSVQDYATSMAALDFWGDASQDARYHAAAALHELCSYRMCDLLQLFGLPLDTLSCRFGFAPDVLCDWITEDSAPRHVRLMMAECLGFLPIIVTASYPRTCIRCSAHFLTDNPSRYTCPDCMTPLQKNRTVGNTYPCDNCGQDYILRGGRQRFCPKCRELLQKAARISPAYFQQRRLLLAAGNRRSYYKHHQERIDRASNQSASTADYCPSAPQKSVVRNPIIERDGSSYIVRFSARTLGAYPTSEAAAAALLEHLLEIPQATGKSGNPISGVAGISWNKGRHCWQVQSKNHYIGSYRDLDEAKAALVRQLINQTKGKDA